ncbi:RCC1/BLIP-II protein [Metschnikowia bicuspidata var. bicuspidata NRRL YB-4993]|uniref:RCC1/BLIP-II protein n=1 Tax=Metschnikowia bicuspidata var. bicuspidata NRRL YB-4993 TaxID=869754 RepID=A0A1A0H969_9ASCO|nr:RCC1/BLIP-II protein [Metschnikowia bicuspidata var. bicuspidata NRRL YB-4993]OBA20556.1 RCC1/BLIP-II protein [Metschnikowia bicuspidata var. bicuspidata NRRL YB-4993]
MVALNRTLKRSASPVQDGRHKRLRSTSSNVLQSYSRLPTIIDRPPPKSQSLDIFVWGTGSMCELGLGPQAKTKEVKRPRLNPFLTSEKLGADGIVDFSVGGMHVLALDSNNVLWSWGTNDSKVLGRDTTGKENLKSMDDAEDSDDDDGDLNSAESTPGKVENLPKTNIKIVQVAATDNLSAVLYENGEVYTWGTFRSNEGLLGYSKEVNTQEYPAKVNNLENIVQLATGKDHVLALDAKGIVYAWGNGQQSQLGRKILERHKFTALQPHTFGLYDIKYIASGDFHCFAIDSNGKVFAWGLNQYGQCGITNKQGELEDGSVIQKPTIIPALEDKNIVEIVGGEHHSLALTGEGELFTWGRYDMKEVGIAKENLPDYTYRDQHGLPRSVPIPTLLRIADGTLKFKAIAAGSHHSFAVTRDGIVYAWGFGDTYGPGLGLLDGDVEIPTRIYNTATKDMDIQIIGAGGQFSVSGGRKLSDTHAAERNEKYEIFD